MSIKLPNDGFLYKEGTPFPTISTSTSNYKLNNFHELAVSATKDPLRSVWSFATKFLGDDDWSPKVLYNFQEQMMDIEIRHKVLPWQISITWEKGYPSQPWVDVDVSGWGSE
jgi:hypothetical protein